MYGVPPKPNPKPSQPDLHQRPWQVSLANIAATSGVQTTYLAQCLLLTPPCILNPLVSHSSPDIRPPLHTPLHPSGPLSHPTVATVQIVYESRPVVTSRCNSYATLSHSTNIARNTHPGRTTGLPEHLACTVRDMAASS